MKKKYVLNDVLSTCFVEKVSNRRYERLFFDLYEMISIDLILVSVHTFWNKNWT